MGKHKQAQRTKNNARPSNSSRSAELLGTSMPSFVGFSAVKDGGYVPILPGLSLCASNDVEMTNVDKNFQIVLKKMNKKDATTKYKALQEFATMCQESELSTVEGTLPFWPKLYSALSVDTEHRVREAAQVAHRALVKRLGKGIAMYLKQLAGPWFTSQYDTYPPAASVATNSFNETFSEKKIVDAIVHCQHEILSYICDNLTVQTAQSVSVQKSIGPDEMETKYQKILISNLQAYSFYFKKVPFGEIEKMMETHKKIVSCAKFWKLAKHDAILIKTSFFALLTSIIANAIVVLQDEQKRTITCIINSLDEGEPGLVSAVWESMLILTNNLEHWHVLVNTQSLLLPKLWRVLRNGGQCCASIVYPNLLPFMRQFHLLSNNTHQLYIDFFNNMRQGLLVKSVQQSRSETFAVIASFTECIRYSILSNIHNPSLCESLLKDQVMAVLETCMTEGGVTKHVFFCEMTHLVRYWSKNRWEEEYKLYRHLVEQFWMQLKILFFNLLNGTREVSSSYLSDIKNSQIELLLMLKNAPAHNRKHLKVTFFDPEECSQNKYQTTCRKTEDDSVFLRELEEFVNELCVSFFNKINENDAEICVENLNELLSNFGNKELFILLMKAFKTNTALEFYNEVLKKWLFEKQEQSVHVIELVFNLGKYMDDGDKDAVLESLIELDDIVILKNVVQCGLISHNRKDVAIKKWCLQTKVTNLLINVAKELASGASTNIDKDQSLILLAFETDENGELLISEEGVNEICAIICNSLKEKCEISLTNFAKLIGNLVALTWTHRHLSSGAKQMLEALFKFCIHEYHTNDDSTFMENMREIWKGGLLKNYEKSDSFEFIEVSERFAAIIWEAVFSLHGRQSPDFLVDIASDFLEVIINSGADRDFIKTITLRFLSKQHITSCLSEVIENVLYGEVITGNLYVASLEQSVLIGEDTQSITLNGITLEDSTEKCLTWALFNANLLNNLRSRLIESDNQDEEEPYLTECDRSNYVLPGITDILLNIMYVSALGHVYSNHYKSTKHYIPVSKLLVSLKKSLETLQKYILPVDYEIILKHIESNSYTYGCMLPYVVQVYCTELFQNANLFECFENCIAKNTSSIPEDSAKIMRLQGVQVLQQHKKLSNIDFQLENNPETYILIRNTIDQNESDELYIHILNKIISSQKEDAALLQDCDVSKESWERMSVSLEVIRLLTQLVKTMPGKLTPEQWDFILISLTLWQLSIKKSQHNYQEFQVTALVIAVSQLYCAVQNRMNAHESKLIEGLPAELLDEWKNVFAPGIQDGIIQTWMFYADMYNEQSGVLKPIITLDNLGMAVIMLDGNIVFREGFDRENIIARSVKLLQSALPSIQLGAYHALKLIIPDLVQRDTIFIQAEKFESGALTIKKFNDILTNMQNIVNAILMDFKLCDTISCPIQPFTDSYKYTLGYSLTWTIVLDMCANAEGELRYQYAETLKKDLFPALLNNIFKLMPVEVHQDTKPKASKIIEIFATAPSLNFAEGWTECKLHHLVCWVYMESSRHLPVLVRQWWSTADSRVSAAVDKITSNYVTPILCQDQLLNSRLASIENLQVKVYSTAREVVVLYQMDDIKLELSIILPPNYPLGPVVVVPSEHARGTSNWRNYRLQLFIFLTHQNGSVWDGLIKWKRNLDKKFAGVEECYICFSIFHITTYQIPKLSCRTCRKKFHTPCLYKWFSTSHKSTCPICRNVF